MGNKEVMNTINKPMSVVKNEFIESLVGLINNNGLPLFMTESILKDFLTEITVAVKEQERMEKIQYEQMLRQQTEQIMKDNADKTENDK